MQVHCVKHWNIAQNVMHEYTDQQLKIVQIEYKSANCSLLHILSEIYKHPEMSIWDLWTSEGFGLIGPP